MAAPQQTQHVQGPAMVGSTKKEKGLYAPDPLVGMGRQAADPRPFFFSLLVIILFV